jgi:hypothetical protein|tara:strand:+ start:110 stop:232 length:123 start_codon:yes stop_codon:yes gene_type:complete
MQNKSMPNKPKKPKKPATKPTANRSGMTAALGVKKGGYAG